MDTDLESRLARWHLRRYGSAISSRFPTFAKLLEEVGELAAALVQNDAHAREEAADCAIVLVHLVRGLGGSLEEEMWRKLEIIEQRLTEEKEK
jgi:NTP pyrophosphatase (non-canonical NTP hydrolase)